MSGVLQRPAQFVFVLEEIGQLTEEHFHKLLRRHWRAIGMPEGRRHHVLDRTVFAIGEFDLDLLPFAIFRSLSFADGRGWQLVGVHELIGSDRFFRLCWFAVPLRVVEVMVCFYEVINREVILTVVKPCATSDDLLELDHRVDWAHQNNVANVPRIYTG